MQMPRSLDFHSSLLMQLVNSEAQFDQFHSYLNDAYNGIQQKWEGGIVNKIMLSSFVNECFKEPYSRCKKRAIKTISLNTIF